jgi:FkbM family methyltransferase
MRRLRALVARGLRRRLGVPSFPASLERLRACGLIVHRAYDIGAYRGDFAAELLRVWPEAELVCFEPLEKRRREIEVRFAANSRVQARPDLLGARSGERVRFGLAETASSVLLEHVNRSIQRVESTTAALDDLIAGGLPAPAELWKLDVQGYELAVLRGGERALAGAHALVLEVNLLDIHQGVPLLDEVTSWLAGLGFVAYDLAGLTRRPLDGALWQVDIAFVRRSSPLRADKRWGS